MGRRRPYARLIPADALPPPPDADLERELLVRWQAAGDVAARDRVVLGHAPVALHWAERWAWTNPRVGLGDLFAEAMTGMLQATDRFDPGRGRRFTTLAFYYAAKNMRDLVMGRRLAVYIPRALREYALKVRRDPDATVPAQYDGECLGLALKALALKVTDPGDIGMVDDFDWRLDLADVLVGSDGRDMEREVAEADERATRAAEVWAHVDGLDDHLKEAMTMVYRDGMSMSEAARKLGRTPSAVRERVRTATATLRRRLVTEVA